MCRDMPIALDVRDKRVCAEIEHATRANGIDSAGLNWPEGRWESK